METPTPTSAARESGASEFGASFPPQFTILGVNLLPLSLGRYRLMKWARVAFVAEQECGATIEDLFTGLAICGMSCAEFRQLLGAGNLGKHLQAWGKVLNKQIKREIGFNIFSKLELFQRYIEAGQELPWIALPVQHEGINDSTLAHWSANVEIVLRGTLGWSKTEVDEEPLTKALADYFKHMENEGHVRLIPPELYKEMIQDGQSNAATLEALSKKEELWAST